MPRAAPIALDLSKQKPLHLSSYESSSVALDSRYIDAMTRLKRLSSMVSEWFQKNKTTNNSTQAAQNVSASRPPSPVGMELVRLRTVCGCVHNARGATGEAVEGLAQFPRKADLWNFKNSPFHIERERETVYSINILYIYCIYTVYVYIYIYLFIYLYLLFSQRGRTRSDQQVLIK